MKSKADASLALMQNIHNVGIMSDLISDGAKGQSLGRCTTLDVSTTFELVEQNLSSVAKPS